MKVTPKGVAEIAGTAGPLAPGIGAAASAGSRTLSRRCCRGAASGGERPLSGGKDLEFDLDVDGAGPEQRKLCKAVGEFGGYGERDNLGELRGRGMAVGRSGERWVPPVEVVGELVVEDPDTDLQQEVRAARGPAHLLLLDHALADQLVDR